MQIFLMIFFYRNENRVDFRFRMKMRTQADEEKQLFNFYLMQHIVALHVS